MTVVAQTVARTSESVTERLPLPIEQPLVRGTIALQEAKQQVDAAYWLLQNNPRLTAPMVESINLAVVRLLDAADAIGAYGEILTCEGQA